MKTYFFSSLEHSNNNQRMHPTLKLVLWMSVFLLFFTFENIYSQQSLDCTNSEPCDSAWKYNSITGNMGSGITGSIWYRHRKCNGIYQVYIDSTKALDNGRFLDSVNRYHYQYSAFSDLVDIYLLQKQFNDQYLIHDNPDSANIIVQLYKASCGVWLKCKYCVYNTEPNCDEGFDPPYPVQSPNVIAELNIYKWHPCGVVCCKKTYEVYRKAVQSNSGANWWIVYIKNMSITRSTTTPECTNEDNFSEPCQDGC